MTTRESSIDFSVEWNSECEEILQFYAEKCRKNAAIAYKKHKIYKYIVRTSLVLFYVLTAISNILNLLYNNAEIFASFNILISLIAILCEKLDFQGLMIKNLNEHKKYSSLENKILTELKLPTNMRKQVYTFIKMIISIYEIGRAHV